MSVTYIADYLRERAAKAVDTDLDLDVYLDLVMYDVWRENVRVKEMLENILGKGPADAILKAGDYDIGTNGWIIDKEPA